MTARALRLIDTGEAHGRYNIAFDHALIELQLAHQERNRVSASYNWATYLPERRKMMQWWADHLDHLRTDTEPPPRIRSGRQRYVIGAE